MTWTFDPLVARNATLQLPAPGRRTGQYQDFYGQMRDGVNAGQASDRMVVSWPLDKVARATLAEADDAFDALAQ